jgi:hypothetical protein
MADYYTPTVIQQTIPEADMTPLERLLLSHVFDTERDDEGWYFFSEVGPVDMTAIGRAALEAALAASELDTDNTANAFVSKLLADLKDDELQDEHLGIDFSETSWESILQDIVRRSPTLIYVSAVSSFICSRIRPGRLRRRRRRDLGRRHPWQVHHRSSRGVYRAGRTLERWLTDPTASVAGFAAVHDLRISTICTATRHTAPPAARVMLVPRPPIRLLIRVASCPVWARRI